VNILATIGPLEDFLPAISCVCRSWSQAFRSDQPRFWQLLAQNQGISLGGGATGCRQYNHSRDFKKLFYRRYRQVHQSRQNEVDEMIQELGRRLRKSDCVTHVRKRLNSGKSGTFSPNMMTVNRAVPSLFHRTLLHLACWWGCRNTVRMLLTDFEASLFVTDDLNASPLLIAAWAGQTGVVKEILVHLRQELRHDKQKMRYYLEQKGASPLTSSCGGKGEKTALVWAYRKGFQSVVNLLLPVLGAQDLKSYMLGQGEKLK